MSKDEWTSVRVGGIDYPAERVAGVLRFRTNVVIRDLVNRGAINLNAISSTINLNAISSKIPIRDRAEFWMCLGYSIDGFCDVFEDLEVVTPDWYRPGKNYDGTPGAMPAYILPLREE